MDSWKYPNTPTYWEEHPDDQGKIQDVGFDIFQIFEESKQKENLETLLTIFEENPNTFKKVPQKEWFYAMRVWKRIVAFKADIISECICLKIGAIYADWKNLKNIANIKAIEIGTDFLRSHNEESSLNDLLERDFKSFYRIVANYTW